MSRLLVILLLILSFSFQANAQVSEVAKKYPTNFHLIHPIHLNVTPLRVKLLYKFAPDAKVYSRDVTLRKFPSTKIVSNYNWLLYTDIKTPPNVVNFSFAILIEEKGRGSYYSGFIPYSKSKAYLSLASEDSLNLKVNDLSTKLKELSKRFTVSKNNLNRIREDYLLITREDKLNVLQAKIEVVEKLEKVQEESIDKSRKFLKLIGAKEQPARYEIRKRNLSNQIAKLQSIVKDTEQQEGERTQRLRFQKEELQEALRATKGKDLKILEAKLKNINAEYLKLQKDLNIDGSQLEEDYLQW